MEKGELVALTAILTTMYRHPELLANHYVEIFQVCCVLADGEKYRRAARAVKGEVIILDGTSSSPELIMQLVPYSLHMIGCGPMRDTISRNEDAFAPTILRCWKSLFGTMNLIYDEMCVTPSRSTFRK